MGSGDSSIIKVQLLPAAILEAQREGAREGQRKDQGQMYSSLRDEGSVSVCVGCVCVCV